MAVINALICSDVVACAPAPAPFTMCCKQHRNYIRKYTRLFIHILTMCMHIMIVIIVKFVRAWGVKCQHVLNND